MFLKGRKVAFKNEHDSKSHGISIIYQELSLIPTLTVVQNMFLGRESRPGRRISAQDGNVPEEYQRICQDFHFDIDPDIVVSRLSIAKQQMVEIMKAISWNAELVIMDEPTTSLTNNEKEGLFRIIGRLREMGKSIIYITHILEEMFRVCDSASIMRNGETGGNLSHRGTDKGEDHPADDRQYGQPDWIPRITTTRIIMLSPCWSLRACPGEMWSGM